MKRALLSLSLILTAGFAAAQNVHTTITASLINDGVNPITGHLCVVPVATGNTTAPAGYRLYGGGQIVANPRNPSCGTVTSGVLQSGFQVPDMLTVQPSPGTLSFIVEDVNFNVLRTDFVQPTGTTWNYDNFVPTTVLAIPAGSQFVSGTGAPTGGCTSPSIYYRQDGGALSECVGGAWAALPGGGTGSGTVNSGTSGQLAAYTSTGTTVSGLALGTNLSITGTTLNAAAGSGAAWGSITGTISAQTDLGTALAAKENLGAINGTNLATTFSGGAGLLKLSTAGAPSPAAAGTDYVAPAALAAYTPLPTNPLTAGLLAEHHYMEGTGTTVADFSGNNNYYTFGCTGAASPVGWVSYGLNMYVTTATPDACLTPATNITDLGTYYAAGCLTAGTQSTGTATTGVLSGNATTWLGTAAMTDGIFISSRYNGASFNPSVGKFAGSGGSYSTQEYGGCMGIAYTVGSPEHLYVFPLTSYGAPVEISYASQANTTAANIVTASTYLPWVSGTSTQNYKFPGVAMYDAYYSSTTVHTIAQVNQEAHYIQALVAQRPGVPTFPTFNQNRAPVAIFCCDSLTAAYAGSATWTTLVTANLTNTYAGSNWGYFGRLARDVDAMLPVREMSSIPLTCGQSFFYDLAGSNDIAGGVTNAASDVWISIQDMASKVKTACPTMRFIVSTIPSRQTYDTTIAAANALIRNGWSTTRTIDALVDLAESTTLSPNGTNNTNTTYYNADHTHGVGCPTYGGVGMYCQFATAYVTLGNLLDGSSSASPQTLTATGTIGLNRYTVYGSTASAAGTLTLPDCSYMTGQTFSVANASSFTVTTATTSSQVNSCTASIPAGSVAKYLDTLTSPTAGGCSWTCP